METIGKKRFLKILKNTLEQHLWCGNLHHISGKPIHAALTSIVVAGHGIKGITGEAFPP